MKKQHGLNRLGGVMLAGALAAALMAGAACQQDPNKNSTVVFGTDGSASTGSGGSGGPVTGPIKGMALATFDLIDGGAPNVSGFALDNYHDTAQKNLNDAMNGLGNAPPTLDPDATQGSPDNGSLKIVAPYTGASQYVDLQRTIGTTMPQNWAGRTLYVRIKVTQGTFSGGVQMYVKTGTAYVFGGTYSNLAKTSEWQEFALNVDNPMTQITGYNNTQVVAFGLQLNTGSAGTGSTQVTFNIDSFSVNPPVGGGASDGGSGGAGGSGGGGAGGSGSGGATGDGAVPTDAATTSDAATGG